MKNFIKISSKIFFVLLCININLFSQYQIQIITNNLSVQKLIDEKYRFTSIKNSSELDSIITQLDKFLKDNGYFSSKISINLSNNDSTDLYNLIIDEGKKFVIKKISIAEKIFTQDEIDRVNSIYGNVIFNQESIDKIGWHLTDLAEAKGYPFALISFNGFNFVDENDKEIFVELNFNLIPNQQAIISHFKIMGNKYTRTEFIIREMRIQQNSVFTPELSKKVKQRLSRLNIFSEIKEPIFYFDDGLKGVLSLEVKEGNTNSFDGIIGYVPSTNLNESGYLTGQVNISLRNLFGTLRSFSFRWNRLTKFSQDLEIKYFEPWLFGYPLNFTPVFQQYKQDTTFIQRSFSSTMDLGLTETFFLSFHFATSQVIPQIEHGISNLNRYSTLNFGIGFVYDSRDNPVYTRNGIYFKTDISQVTKKDYGFSGVKKFNQNKGNFNFSIFLELFKDQNLFLSLNGKVILGDGISISDLFRFGGSNTLRGYEENQFSGSKIFWSNLEYRFFISYFDFISAFLDYGYYFRDIMNEKVSRFKYGYGMGMAFNTQLGLLKISYALGEGDSFSRGKIHFGVESGF